jgi:peptide/nickel transport system permease protein
MVTIAASQAQEQVLQPSRTTLLLRYLRRNKSLVFGLLILLFLVTFTVYGLLTINPKDAYPLAARSKQPPSLRYPLGTDFFGRNLYASMVVGIWQTALIGVLAGGLGTLIGVVLGFISAYFGGLLDTLIKGICQILTPIPALLIQVVIAGSIDKLSGVGDLGIIFGEILPNLLPFIAAAFVNQVFVSVFASLYLTVLGLGPLREPLMGNLIWAAQGQSAFFNGWWWWPLFPALAMVLILGSLALINMGLDELANPRVRRTE